MIESAIPTGDNPVDQGNINDARFYTTVCVSPGHPCLPGHFPNHPLVPGVVILEHVATALRDWRHQKLSRVLEAKFLAPLHPGETADLELHDDAGRIRFSIQHEQRVLARGIIEGAA